MKLVAMLRVKNQILTIHQCLRKLSQLVDEIVIVDNGSTDGTLSAYEKYKKIVNITKTKGYHEGRDKILAHKMAKVRHPDWILWIDADEIFESSTTRAQLENYMNQPDLDKVEFRMFNFWKSKNYFRVDGVWCRYTAFPQRHMWRNLKEAYFKNLMLHNGGIQGITGRHLASYIRLKHYGYVWPKKTNIRYQTYASMKNNPRSHKTLPLDEESLKIYQWREFSNPGFHWLWQHYQSQYWKLCQIRYNLSS